MFEMLDSILKKAINAGEIPCATYHVKKNGMTMKQGSIGQRQLTPLSLPVSETTWFDLASVTKVIFASTVLCFVDSGEISLSEPLLPLIPEWNNTNKGGITPWHLLTHSSGYPGQIKLYETNHTRKDLLTAALNLPLKSELGKQINYSSQGFMVLEEWLERKGLDWRSTLFEKILGPLGITGIRFGPFSADEDVAATEFCPWRGKIVVGEVHDENALVLGGNCAHAGLFGQVSAVAKLGQAILDHYHGRRSDIWSPTAVRTMCRNHTPTLNNSRGLGWQAWEPVGSPGGDLMSSSSFGHTGFTGTSIWIDPLQSVVAVLLTNRVHPSRETASIVRLRQVFHNLVISCCDRSRN